MSTQPNKIRLAIFISGRGSNMKALIEACQNADYPAEIAVVLSNKPDAPGLDYAKNAGLQTRAVNHKDYDNRETFETALLEALTSYNVDVICLAGFMRILTPHFIESWGKPMINIHPSLLPKYKGLDTHQRALDAGDSEAGCTVHYVVPEVDSGEIIVQKSVSIEAGDTADTLAARVLEQEHIAYPEAVKIVAGKHLQEM